MGFTQHLTAEKDLLCHFKELLFQRCEFQRQFRMTELEGWRFAN